MQHTVIGFFSTTEQAQEAVSQLRAIGLAETDIDYISNQTGSPTSMNSPYDVSDESRYNDEAREPGNPGRDTLNEDRISDRKGRDEHDEGIGDSIGRFFRNLFDNREEAEKYATAGRKNCIVSVHAPTSADAERAADILDSCGAVDIDERTADTRTGDYTQSIDETQSSEKDRTAFDTSISDARNDLGPGGDKERDFTDKSIPVIEENANVGKREVERGGVRVRARIVEKPVEENLRLREEHIYVDRKPVDRPASERDFANFKEGEIELTESAEVPVVDKEARVTEEVRLGKDVTERDEVIRDSVRRTDIDIEDVDRGERERKDKKDF